MEKNYKDSSLAHGNLYSSSVFIKNIVLDAIVETLIRLKSLFQLQRLL